MIPIILLLFLCTNVNVRVSPSSTVEVPWVDYAGYRLTRAIERRRRARTLPSGFRGITVGWSQVVKRDDSTGSISIYTPWYFRRETGYALVSLLAVLFIYLSLIGHYWPAAGFVPMVFGGNSLRQRWLDIGTPSSATIVVAASNAKNPQDADYVCDGTDDQIEINSAIASLPAGGGKIVFSEGDFYLNKKSDFATNFCAILVNSNMVLEGQGDTTKFHLNDGQNVGVIRSPDGVVVNNITVRDMWIDGNFANNPTVVGTLANCNVAIMGGSTGVNLHVINVTSIHARTGGALVQGQGVSIEDCYFHNNKVVQAELLSNPTVGGGGFIMGCTSLIDDGTIGPDGYGVDTGDSCIIANNTIIIGTTGVLSLGLYTMNNSYRTIIHDNIIRLTPGAVAAGYNQIGISDNGQFSDVHDNYIEMLRESGGGPILHGTGCWWHDNTFVMSRPTAIIDINDAFLLAPIRIERNRILGGYPLTPVVTAGILEPRTTQSIQCYLAYGTNNCLAASANGTYSATAQPDVASGRSTTFTLTKGTGDGAGVVTATGLDQFGNARSITKTWTAGAGGTVAIAGFLASINVNGIVISGLSGDDTISVGFGSGVGYDHKIFTGATKKSYKSGVGNYPLTSITEDVTYHGVTFTDNIAANETYQITSLDCLA